MDGAPRGARTASEEEELRTVGAALSQARSALAALQQRGQTGAAPFERLEAQCGELKERQRWVAVWLCLSVCPSVRPSVCLSVCLSGWLAVCLPPAWLCLEGAQEALRPSLSVWHSPACVRVAVTMVCATLCVSVPL